MSEAELVRSEVKLLDLQQEEAEAKATLAAKARAVLNYDYATSDQEKRMREREYATQAIFALSMVGIQPFTLSSVGKYQRKRLREMTLKYLVRNFSNSDAGDGTMCTGGGVGIIATLASAISYGIFFDDHGFHPLHAPWYCKTFLSLALIGYVLWVGIASVRSATNRVRITHNWEPTHLHHYAQLVPDFVLAHAVALKEVLPTASFDVEWLQRQERTYTPPPRIDTDPFLVMCVGQQRYYIDVWDEKDFERKN